MNGTGLLIEGIRKGVLSSSLEGSIVDGLFSAFKSGLFKENLDNWKKTVEDRLNMLRDVQIDQLIKNRIFANVFLTSAQLAIKTNEKKAKLLANAVANTANTSLSEDRIIVLLNCIERYSLSHLKMLLYLQNPKVFFKGEPYMGSPMSYYHNCFPNNDEALDRVINRDLFLDGMIDIESLEVTATGNGCIEKHTKQLGDDMISYFGIGIETITQKLNTYESD